MNNEQNILLSVRKLTTSFNTSQGLVKAVDNISFDIKKGTIFALVGRTGCGKTATALSILRLIPKHQGGIVDGEILFRNRNLAAIPEKKMRNVRGCGIAMIFQNPASSLNPVFTIGSQIIEMIRLHHKKNKKQAIEDAIELLTKVGIEQPQKKIKQYPHQLSGGMLQRVMLAIALSCRPELLIADEPTSSLDVTTEKAILDLLCDLKKTENIGILLITHNLAIVADRADYIAVMQKGRIVEQGDTYKIIKNPSHPYTKSLLADAARNKL